MSSSPDTAYRSTVIAANEDHIALKCFEVVGEFLFMCFASGKMEIINKTTQAAVRKGISAHGAEIKCIARGLHPFVYTACVDNQVRMPFACLAAWSADTSEPGPQPGLNL